ncbi:hypothetical protein [Streptomyces sp. NBC_01262]|uniref:hypothetical protein n=1 Tax=Streptomyces sp. NBC_01262 TaxID=2903803 RepID=UPI002E35163C|nr:hypothetical protein [Streptomyces sp. NBC_01262]
MTARCELTELLADSCAHCLGHTDPAPDPPPPVNTGRWFHAIYPGVCEVCGNRFTPGTPIRLEIPKGWRAACCADGAPS